MDDDPGIREFTADFLSGHGYVVDTAGNGAEMRAALVKSDYALIVLDVMMPGEDGPGADRICISRSSRA